MAYDMDLRFDSLNVISLCTGGGGLDRALELAIPSARPVLCVEREAFSVANLVAQMQRGVMAASPIWSDVRTVPGRRFRGRVDGVIGGIPCQPHSLAGKRLGREDERDLWAPARRIFVQSGAWFILIENVGGMLSSGGAERVYRDLLRLGCKVEGGIFRASEVGANHERERLFILGVADASGAGRQGGGSDGDRPGQHATAERGGGAMADADVPQLCRQPSAGEQLLVQQDHGANSGHLVHAASIGRGEGRPEPELRRGRDSAGIAICELADSYRPGSPSQRRDAGEVGCFPEAQRQSEYGAALSARGSAEVVDSFGGGRDRRPCEPQWTAEERAAVEWASQGPLFAPGPGDAESWRRIAQQHPERLPAVSRYDLFRIACRKAGVDPDEHPRPRQEVGARQAQAVRASIIQEVAQSTLRRGSDGLATRIDELRMLGNGVSDLQGAYAVRSLATDLAPRSAGAALLVRLMEQTR